MAAKGAVRCRAPAASSGGCTPLCVSPGRQWHEEISAVGSGSARARPGQGCAGQFRWDGPARWGWEGAAAAPAPAPASP